jgi:hypothetical protein
MKKGLLTLGAIALVTTTFSQQQIGNSNFETWEVVASPDEEPVNWSSFLTASGSLSGFASNQLTKSTDVRPGSTGTYSARIFANEVLGVIANGNLTTGRINMGSATPSSPNNYSSTVLADPAFSEAFTDEPDSLVFWAKFTPVNPADQASVSAILHDNYAHRDPIDAASAAHTVGIAATSYPSTNGQWVRFSVPFVYSGPATTTSYMLLTFGTNPAPGSGSDNDQVWIDDVELIYNPTGLNEFTADLIGVTVDGDQLLIQSQQQLNGTATIWSAAGQLIGTSEIAASIPFKAPRGIYFVVLDTQYGAISKKVVND